MHACARVHSPERLLDHVAFYLHRNVAKLPEDKRQLLIDLHQSDKLWPARRC